MVLRDIVTLLIKNNIIKKNIIDLGAWIGDNALPWSKNINAIVYAIDPSRENCQYITDTANLNNIENIKVIRTAISNKIEILSTNDDLFHCSFVFDKPELNGKNKIISTSLDELHRQNQITDIDFIHLDVEGMEFKVIQGAENIINRYQPIIIFEQHLEIDDYMGLANHLSDKNYRVYIIKETLKGCRPDCRNFIAIPFNIEEDVVGLIQKNFDDIISKIV
jgi:FkbM family methyltransferase